MNGARGSIARRILLLLAAIAGAFVVLVVALVLLVDSNLATRRAMDLVLPRVSAALGRDVTVKGAKLRIFPNPRVSLAGLAVAGRPGEPALVETDALDVEVGLWPLLRSLGKDVEVRAFALVRPRVNLVRARDGTWNYEGLGAKGAPPSPAAPEPPATRPEGGRGARVAVSDVKVSKAVIRMIDRSAGRDDTGVALENLDLDASGVGPGLPLRARLAASLAESGQNVHADIAVARLPEGVPQRPEDWPEIRGSISLATLSIDRIRSLLPGEIGAIVRGGTARLDATVRTDQGRTYQLEGTGEMKDVRLRGKPASGRFRAAASWTPARPEAARVAITDLALRGPGIDLGGNASLETAPIRASFELKGPLLDLDEVMGLLPESETAKKAPPPAGELVPEAMRRQIDAAVARGTIAIGELRAGRIRAKDVKARAALQGGTLSLEQMDASVFGGRVSAAGTRVSLAQKEPAWNLAASLSSLDVADAIKAFAGRSPLLGRMDGSLHVAGTGTDWARMRDGLDGLAALAIRDGTLTSADLGGTLLGGIAKGLDAAGRGALAKRLGRAASGKTTFKDFAGKFGVKDGFLSAQSPVQLRTDAGELSLGGRLGLDGRLDLQGTARVPRQVLSQVVSGIPLPESADVPLGLGGTLASPRISVRGDAAVAGLLKGQARRATEALRQEAEKSGRKKVEGLFKRFGGKR